ncbi:MAG: 6-phosphofructokinase [Bacteroidales bacterium]|jgi:6-phosphofructokinase 1|nr:6-phosphofructokinase [Bacteroidales bacterium]MCI2121767.1 6-phosphofructokinase [Bacteroidales bacterium]MCI2144753.1 6-phosphofructokinase [Bacteroidales bacterium]
MKDSIIILTGGGPAPGMNTVVGTITKAFIANGYRVIGLHGGYQGLFEENPRIEDMNFAIADSIFNRGGSYLMMSRYKPTDEDFEKRFNLKLFYDNNVKLLVTVGGDDTASTANRISKFLLAKHYDIKNIHVPKTIDNDLPLPMNTPTFGFNSAKAEGCRIAQTVYEDARTSGNWFLVSAMGRTAGHLALGIGAACHYPMIIIPEMFNKTKISVDKIINLSISSIIKRKIMGITYGGIMIAEGVFDGMDPEDLKATGLRFTYDEHGHPELGKISKAQLFNDLMDMKFKKLGLKIKTRPIEIGYDIRCVAPIAYDLMYCSQLGFGVYELFHEGETGCMVYVDQMGEVRPLYLKDLQDPVTGKILPRVVDIDGDMAQGIYKYLVHYLTPSDYGAAKKWIPDPENYDFYKILNW